VGALTALLVLAVGARAEAGGARLRWMPSADPRTTGYYVYVRHAGSAYGAPLDAGQPAVEADGSMAYRVSGLSAGETYYFAVSAYTADAIESGLSAELVLGAANPCVVDRCVTPTACDFRPVADGSSCDDGLYCNGIAVCQAGVCRGGPPPSCSDGVACTTDRCDEALARCVHVAQPGCCTTDADCRDTDVCTSGEHCAQGTCVSLAVSCPASACADAFCDPQAGCSLMPTPDGVTCADGCDALEPRRITLAAAPDSASLTLRARFRTDGAIDPANAGLSIELADPTGAPAWSATVPGYLFAAKSNGTKFRYGAAPDGAAATGGVSSVILRRRAGGWLLSLRAAAPELLAAVGQPALAATVRFGDACVRDATLTCAGDPGQASLCR
jgi:hypothetical protein